MYSVNYVGVIFVYNFLDFVSILFFYGNLVSIFADFIE